MFPAKRFYPEFQGEVLPVRPYGLFLNVTSTLTGPDPLLEGLHEDFVGIDPSEYHYEGFVEGFVAGGFYARSPIAFTLPRANPDGFFKIGSTLYLFANVGFVSPWAPLQDGQYHYLTKQQVALRVIENLFGSKDPSIPGQDEPPRSYSPFSNFFFQSRRDNILEVNVEYLQSTLLSRLATHPFIRQCSSSELQTEGNKDLVVMYPRPDGVKIDPLKFNAENLNKLDPCSTSTSNTVNRVYQLSEGAKIKKGQITPGPHMLCEFTRDNSTFLELSPRRAYLARAAVMNSAVLTHPEERPISSDEAVVQTRNLRLAVMDLGYATYEDTIAVSKTCALMFEAQAVTRITRWTKEPITDLKVQRNDLVRPGGILAVNLVDAVEEEGIHDVSIGVEQLEDVPKVVLVAAELREQAVLEDIEVTPAWYAGERGVRTTFVLRSFLSMRTGDKITCFSGCKGVVIVVPDEDMPVIAGETADICVSPYSIFKRGTVGLLLEAAVGKAAEAGKFEHVEAHGDEYPVAFDWAAMHFRSKSDAYYKGKLLPNKVFWGIVPWMRCLKSGIAARRWSAVSANRPLTGEGLLTNKAKNAGQKMDASKALVIASRGMHNTLKALLGDTPHGLSVLADTVAAIDGPAHDRLNKT